MTLRQLVAYMLQNHAFWAVAENAEASNDCPKFRLHTVRQRFLCFKTKCERANLVQADARNCQRSPSPCLNASSTGGRRGLGMPCTINCSLLGKASGKAHSSEHLFRQGFRPTVPFNRKMFIPHLQGYKCQVGCSEGARGQALRAPADDPAADGPGRSFGVSRAVKGGAGS